MAFTSDQKSRILTQVLEERKHALEYRQRRELKWRKTDDLYYGNKRPSLFTRANIHLPVLHGAVENLLSKIDGAPSGRYISPESADALKIDFLQKSLKLDSQINDWDSLDTYSKKEAVMYGRSIEKKFAFREDGKFKDVRELVMCIDFLIDPLAGGLDPFRKARFCGQDNIIRTEFELKNSKKYKPEDVAAVLTKIQSDSRANSRNNEHTYRKSAQKLDQFAYVSDDAVNLTEWVTTFEGEKVYVFFSPAAQLAIEICPLSEKTKYDEFPYSSWAAFADPEEFWSLAPAELFHDINYAQNVSVSQLLDNSAQRNYGMKAYDTSKITSPAFLDPKPGGRIPVNGNPNDAILDITFPSIGENLQLLNWFGSTVNSNTGNNDSARGIPHSKRMSAAEFEGLVDQVADRVFTHNRQYLSHYKRLLILYAYGVWEFMEEDRSIEVDGVMGVNKIYMSGSKASLEGDFSVEVKLEETQESQRIREERLAFIQRSRENPRMNQRFLDELEAQSLDFTDDEIARLTTTLPDDTWRSVAEASKENEELLKKKVEPNKAATLAHVQRHLDAARYVSGLTDSQRTRIVEHAQSEIPIAEANLKLSVSRALQEQNAVETSRLGQPEAPMPGGMMPPTAEAPAPEAPMPPMPPQPMM